MSDWSRLAGFADAQQLRMFGEIVSYITQAGSPVDMSVVWGVPLDPKLAATAWAPATSFPAGYVKGDTVIRGTRTYTVAGFVLPNQDISPFPRPDDAGAVTLALRFLQDAAL
jgi:hypothetical protein